MLSPEWKRLASLLALLVVVAATAAAAAPSSEENNNVIWKEDAMKELRVDCGGGDSIACLRMKVLEVLDNFLKKDTFKLTDSVAVLSTSSGAEDSSSNASEEGRSANESWAARAVRYLRTHDVQMQTPAGRVTLSSRALDAGRLDLSLQFEDVEDVQGEEGRSKIKKKLKKSKLKKIIVPVMVLVLLKALTVIPLILGILGMKAFNALQLGFGSFVISMALAIFQLCQKLMSRDAPPVPAQIIAAHPGGWEARVHAYPPVGMGMPAAAAVTADELAYNGYQP